MDYFFSRNLLLLGERSKQSEVLIFHSIMWFFFLFYNGEKLMGYFLVSKGGRYRIKAWRNQSWLFDQNQVVNYRFRFWEAGIEYHSVITNCTLVKKVSSRMESKRGKTFWAMLCCHLTLEVCFTFFLCLQSPRFQNQDKNWMVTLEIWHALCKYWHHKIWEPHI